MRSRAEGSSWQRITGSPSRKVIGLIRFGSTVATVRQIHSAIRRFEFERSGLDTCLALAGRCRERALPRRESGNGLAARGFLRTNGTKFACVTDCALAV